MVATWGAEAGQVNRAPVCATSITRAPSDGGWIDMRISGDRVLYKYHDRLDTKFYRHSIGFSPEKLDENPSRKGTQVDLHSRGIGFV